MPKPDVSCDHVFYAFDPSLKPAFTVAQGKQLTLETQDCFSNQISSADQKITALDWDRINPATGPVYIEGVKAGDLVRIKLLGIYPTGHSTMLTLSGEGALTEYVQEPETIIMDNYYCQVVLPTARGALELPTNLMVGVIGLAPTPEQGAISNSMPGEHGGNLDCTLVEEGASLYLRAGVDGGLFGCGDLHSAMGDGEVSVCGAETPGLVTITTDTLDEPRLPVPFLENEDYYVSIASAETIDAATKLANDNMFAFLTDVVGLTINDSVRLMSLVGNLRFCQIVNPLATIRFEFPKWVLHELGFAGLGTGA